MSQVAIKPVKTITLYDRDAHGQADAVLSDPETGTDTVLFSAPSITQLRKQLGQVKRQLNLLGTPVQTLVGTPYRGSRADVRLNPTAQIFNLPPRSGKVFSATQRYDMAANIVDICLTSDALHSLVLVGRGGTGKSHIVLNRIKRQSLERVHAEVDAESGQWVHIKGGLAPTELYKLLYRARRGIVVFDDADSCWEDEIRTNILKAVLDTSDVRTVTWLSPRLAQEGYPTSFTFEGKVIFISNRTMDRIPEPILTRAMLLNLDLTNQELIERVRVIADDLMPTLTAEQREELLDFIEEHQHAFKSLSLRSFIKGAGIIAAGVPNWQDLILFSL